MACRHCCGIRTKVFEWLHSRHHPTDPKPTETYKLSKNLCWVTISNITQHNTPTGQTHSVLVMLLHPGSWLHERCHWALKWFHLMSQCDVMRFISASTGIILTRFKGSYVHGERGVVKLLYKWSTKEKYFKAGILSRLPTNRCKWDCQAT